VLLAQRTVSEEQPETPQITKTAMAKEPDETITEEQTTPAESVLLSVSEEERNKIIAAYIQGIPQREICAYLRWGSAKYSTIVKPVLDAYEQQP
jgi:DNA-directed RNA polymerase specialized sigma24 family protein